MPIGGSNTEPPKKSSHKKRRLKQKSKSKQRLTDKNQTVHPIKNVLNGSRCDLTPDNLSSLRWDNVLTDPTLENDRIEHYKELRRQRYVAAQQQAILTLTEQMKITAVNVSKK